MATTFDTTSKRIILDSAYVDTVELYSAWKQWIRTGDNAKYLPAFRVVGGDPLSASTSIPCYIFLINGWRIRPMETSHTLHIVGGAISVEEGGDPIVPTLGNFNVLVDREVPVAAIGVVGGSSGGLNEAQMRAILADVIVKANIRKVNDITVGGVGTENNPFGPA